MSEFYAAFSQINQVQIFNPTHIFPFLSVKNFFYEKNKYKVTLFGNLLF